MASEDSAYADAIRRLKRERSAVRSALDAVESTVEFESPSASPPPAVTAIRETL
ncbi:hypothetical protein [Haloarcula marina]|uniref:hypothetical protein n=1 Tax=Haloarcula marina TaxID=2961574 RepID=UPI0020B78AD0|nr:hypothetical protein [Halomicroarcula marina]